MSKSSIHGLTDYLIKPICLTKNAPETSNSWRAQLASLALILFIALIAFWRIKSKIVGIDDPYWLRDFYFAYYPAGHLVFSDPGQLYDFTKVEFGPRVGLPQPVIYGFVNLPIVAYLFTPFSWLGQFPGDFLFTLIGVLTVIFSGWLLIRLADLQGWKRIVFSVLLALNAPIFNSIWLGNSTHIVLLLVIASFCCLRGKKDAWSGALLAIAGLIKIPLLFPILYFVLRKRWQAVKGFFATLLAIVSLSILVCGFNLNLVWFQKCILTFSGKVVAGDTVQSVDSFLIRLLTNAPISSYDYVEGDWVFKLLRYAVFLVLIGGTMLTMLRSRSVQSTETESLEFSSFLCLTLLISPISWTHYYLLLVLPIALYMGGQLGISNRWQWSAAMVLSIVLLITPNIRNIPHHPVMAALTRHILVSHYFWGGILLLGVLLATLIKQQKLSSGSSSISAEKS